MQATAVYLICILPSDGDHFVIPPAVGFLYIELPLFHELRIRLRGGGAWLLVNDESR